MQARTSGIPNYPEATSYNADGHYIETREKYVEAKIMQSGIPKRYLACKWDGLDTSIPAQAASQYNQARVYTDNLTANMREGRGLLFRGPVGTMKTSMAVAVVMEAIRQDRSAMFITMASLLDTIFSLKDISRDEWAKFETRLRTVKFLLLDDLGAEYSEGWLQTKVDAIVSERYNAMLPMIITTNLTGEKLAKTYAARIVDRIQYTSEVITFTGESLRTR